MNHIIDSLGASIFDHFELNVLYLNDIIDCGCHFELNALYLNDIIDSLGAILN